MNRPTERLDANARRNSLTARALNTLENMLQAWVRIRRAQAQEQINRACYSQIS